MKSIIPEGVTATSLEAYIAFMRFLEEYNRQRQFDDINGLLSEMSLTTFGYMERSADPCLWHDWEKSLEEVLIETGAIKKERK
jgi:hypothetical protein